MIKSHKNKHELIKMCLHPLAELLSEGSEHPSLILLLPFSVRNSRKLRVGVPWKAPTAPG